MMRWYRNLIAALTLLAGVSASAAAQESTGWVHGTVVTESGQPLAGVIVFVQGVADSTLTDPRGEFHIANVPAGQVTVNTRYVGRPPQQMTVSVRPGEMTEAKFRLKGAVQIEGIVVTAAPTDQVAVKPLQLLTLPATASLTITQARQTVNLMDAEDAVKYLPSVTMRKRNNGDTQTVMGTRIWGINSSARSLVFADGLPLSTLIGNNNTFASPRWAWWPRSKLPGST